MREADVKFADETSWKLWGKLCWLWAAATSTVAVFVIHGKRGGDGLAAKVVEAIYLGQMVRYHLAIEGEEARPMVATVPFVGRAYATGDSVKVSWDAADLWPVAQ